MGLGWVEFGGVGWGHGLGWELGGAHGGGHIAEKFGHSRANGKGQMGWGTSRGNLATAGHIGRHMGRDQTIRYASGSLIDTFSWISISFHGFPSM